MSAKIRISTTEDAVATIAALATKAIAADGHEGHDLERVGRIITSDPVLDKIREAFTRHLRDGKSVKDAMIAAGQTLIAVYCDSAGIPTSR